MQTKRTTGVLAGMMTLRTLPPPRTRFSAPEPPPEAAPAAPQLDGDAMLEQMIRLL